MIQCVVQRPSPAESRPDGAVRLARLSRRQPEIRAQLICFPPTAGGFFSFQPWLKSPPGLHPLLPGDLELWGAQFPWEAGWTCSTLIPALTDALEAQRHPVPLILCGASLGALLAYLVALELHQRQARSPLGLVVIAMSAPQQYRPPPLGEDWAPDAWRARLRRVGGTPEHVLDDLARLEHLRQQVQGGLRIAHSYAYREEPPLAIPIAAFGGDADQEVAPPSLDGWRRQTTSTFTSFLYPEAGHLDVLQAPHIRASFLTDLRATVEHWLQGAA